MNGIKKANVLISPEPLLNARRSSLPLSLEGVLGQSPLIDLVKRFNYSPRNLKSGESDERNLPRITLQSPNATSSCDSKSFFTPKTDKRHSLGIKELAVPCLARRASCEGAFVPPSPSSEPRVKSSLWSNHSVSYSNNISPVQRKTEELRKRKNVLESSPSIIHPSLHFPSLSPCFEGKPKQNFSFFQAEKDHQSCKVSERFGEIFKDNKGKILNGTNREFIREFLSPTLFYDGKFTSKIKHRRNSLDTASSFIASPLKNSNSIDLQNGNPELLHLLKAKNVDSNILGKGGFGVVRIGYWHGEKVAIKILKGKKALTSVGSEEYSLTFGHNSNLVETKAIIISKDSFQAEIKYIPIPKSDEIECDKMIRSYTIPVTDLKHVIGLTDDIPSDKFPLHWSVVISELCTSDNLLSLLNINAPISDKDKLRFLYQITSAVKYIHDTGYAHLDVKPSNCFLTSSGVVKLGDFGCTCKLNEIPKQSLGTVAYQAPETLKGHPVTDRCDIYSLGITIWQLLTREVPYLGEHPHVIIYKVIRMHHRPSSVKAINISFIEEVLFSLAKRCWSVLPTERPPIDTLLSIVTSIFYSCSVSSPQMN